MTVETATKVEDLNSSYPAVGDLKSEGDDHIRKIKSVLLYSFAGISSTGATGFNVVTQSAGNNTTLAASTAFVKTAFDAATDVATQGHAATSKATPVDADEIPIVDSAASWGLKKLTWANLKETLRTTLQYLSAATGAVTRSLFSKVGETVSVKDFGAVGDGSTDDTVAIQAAITAVGTAGGGVVFIPNGTYLLSATLTITLAKTTIRGQSKGGTIITRATNYGSTFDFHGDSGTGALLGDCGIESLTITSTALTTSGAHINFTGVTRSYIKNIYFSNGFIGMQLNGAAACTIDDVYLVFTNLFGGSATGRRYMSFGNAGGSYSHKSSGDIFVSNFNVRGNTANQNTEYGIRIESADGIWFTNGHIGNTSVANISINGGSAEPLNLVYFNNVMSDEGTTYSLLFNGATSPDFRDIKFSNCNFKSGGVPAHCDYGIVVAAACTVQHLLFDNCTVSEFGLGGVILQSTASRMLKFSGCHVFGNGRDTPGSEPGYNLSASVQDVEISGGLSGRLYNGSGSGTQSYGVQLNGSHTNVRLLGVDLTGNTTGSVGGGNTAYIADCLTTDSSVVTNTAATLTIESTTKTVIQTTTGATYTLPAASTSANRTLYLVTQFAGAVISASSNVVPIAGGAAGTAILAATAGKFAVLQSNGTNWLIVSAN